MENEINKLSSELDELKKRRIQLEGELKSITISFQETSEELKRGSKFWMSVLNAMPIGFFISSFSDIVWSNFLMQKILITGPMYFSDQHKQYNADNERTGNSKQPESTSGISFTDIINTFTDIDDNVILSLQLSPLNTDKCFFSGLLIDYSVFTDLMYQVDNNINNILEIRNNLKVKYYEEMKRARKEVLNEIGTNTLEYTFHQDQVNSRRTELHIVADLLVERIQYLYFIREQLTLILKENCEVRKYKIYDIINNINQFIINNEIHNLIFDKFDSIFPNFYLKLSKINPNLSGIELKICQLIKLHLSNKEIANILFIKERTIEKHRQNIRKKLKLDRSVNFELFLKSM